MGTVSFLCAVTGSLLRQGLYVVLLLSTSLGWSCFSRPELFTLLSSDLAQLESALVPSTRGSQQTPGTFLLPPEEPFLQVSPGVLRCWDPLSSGEQKLPGEGHLPSPQGPQDTLSDLGPCPVGDGVEGGRESWHLAGSACPVPLPGQCGTWWGGQGRLCAHGAPPGWDRLRAHRQEAGQRWSCREGLEAAVQATERDCQGWSSCCCADVMSARCGALHIAPSSGSAGWALGRCTASVPGSRVRAKCWHGGKDQTAPVAALY